MSERRSVIANTIEEIIIDEAGKAKSKEEQAFINGMKFVQDCYSNRSFVQVFAGVGPALKNPHSRQDVQPPILPTEQDMANREAQDELAALEAKADAARSKIRQPAKESSKEKPKKEELANV